ncbi:hypothetical protein WICPIJ_005615 [Wickerhamomyces pijperi]|uniref:Uncharacterized protein n=1 Tax=Wickerhamomyces pijperi TaxID=599730 RepID=A0A9P8Q3H6_WICPI|nr:hypothetical protein WICPIJ_005615 [Wickerhamomyces pijperi]
MTSGHRDGIGTEHVLDFVDNGVSGSFDTVGSQDGGHIVGGDVVDVDEVVVFPHGLEVDTLGGEDSLPGVVWLWVETTANVWNFLDDNLTADVFDNVHHKQLLGVGVQFQLEVTPGTVGVVEVESGDQVVGTQDSGLTVLGRLGQVRESGIGVGFLFVVVLRVGVRRRVGVRVHVFIVVGLLGSSHSLNFFVIWFVVRDRLLGLGRVFLFAVVVVVVAVILGVGSSTFLSSEIGLGLSNSLTDFRQGLTVWLLLLSQFLGDGSFQRGKELRGDGLFQMFLGDVVLVVVLLAIEELEVDLVGSGTRRTRGFGNSDVINQFREHNLSNGTTEGIGLFVVNFVQDWQSHLWSLDRSRGSHDDFSHTRNTQSHIGGTVTSEMESVQSHLSGWFTDGLGGDNTD